MKISRIILAGVAAFAFASAAQASSVVIGSCDAVTDGDAAGCLFSGNINENPDPTNQNGYVYAQDGYNAWADTQPIPDNEHITLQFLTASDHANFGDFGSITGDGGLSGTFDLSGFDIAYYAVKAGNAFVLYEYLGTDGTGNWAVGGRNGLSHIAFFGTPGTTEAPEPGTWAMMLLGFGAVGGAMRRRRRGTALQIA
jgi:hypothetical protein